MSIYSRAHETVRLTLETQTRGAVVTKGIGPTRTPHVCALYPNSSWARYMLLTRSIISVQPDRTPYHRITWETHAPQGMYRNRVVRTVIVYLPKTKAD